MHCGSKRVTHSTRRQYERYSTRRPSTAAPAANRLWGTPSRATRPCRSTKITQPSVTSWSASPRLAGHCSMTTTELALSPEAQFQSRSGIRRLYLHKWCRRQWNGGLGLGTRADATYNVLLRSFDADSTGSRSSTWTEVSGGSAVTIASPYTFDGSVTPTGNDQYAMRASLVSSPAGTRTHACASNACLASYPRRPNGSPSSAACRSWHAPTTTGARCWPARSGLRFEMAREGHLELRQEGPFEPIYIRPRKTDAAQPDAEWQRVV